jgi:glycosyltransferase involved in cell wall biosynthesis
MRTGPLVSVIIPTYNRAGIISRTIDDVFRQTYQNFELIIVDDGSTDETLSLLSRYGDRIQVVTQTNAGPAAARNHGVRVARGEIIAFQDSDDLWQPSKLDRQVSLLEMDRSIPCCLCNVLMRVVDGKPITSFDHSLVRFELPEGFWLNLLDVLATRFILFNQAAAIRRQAFEKVGGFRTDLKYLEDYDLPLRLAMEGPWAFIREPLVLYGEATPMSFSEQAKKDPVVLTECELAIYDQVLVQAAEAGSYRSAYRSLKRRQGIARRRLAAATLQRTDGLLDRMITPLLVKLDRYRGAALRRSPWYPQPRAISPEAYLRVAAISAPFDNAPEASL